MVKMDRNFDGLEQMRQTCDNLGNQEIDKSCYLGLLADGYLQAEDFDNAGDTADEALELTRNTGENYFTAELLRIKGEVFRMKNAVDDAEASFQKAIDFARGQGATWWEKKATESLALLRRSKPLTWIECFIGSMRVSWFATHSGLRMPERLESAVAD